MSLLSSLTFNPSVNHWLAIIALLMLALSAFVGRVRAIRSGIRCTSAAHRVGMACVVVIAVASLAMEFAGVTWASNLLRALAIVLLAITAFLTNPFRRAAN